VKQGLTLTELAAKIEADKARKRDVLVDTRQMAVLATPDSPTPTLHLPDGTELDMQHHLHRQIGQRVGIRADYYDRLRESHPALYTSTVNTLFREQDPRFTPGQYLVRTYKDGGNDGRGIGRAFLSNGYRPIDHDAIAEAAFPVLARLQTEGGHQLDFHSIQVTDDKLYIKVVIPTVSYNLADYGPQHRPEAKINDVVQMYLLIKNSEVGTGGFDVERGIFKLSCLNGMTTGSILKKRHVGRKLEANEDLSIYQDDTREADDKALMLKLRDVLTDAVDAAKFELVVKEFAAAKDTPEMEKPIKAMEELAQRVKLSEGESQSALQHLLRDGDLTKFGAVNAITRMAQDVQSYDRSTELEALACDDVLRMPARDWEKVAATV
jgi:hypothetical protein